MVVFEEATVIKRYRVDLTDEEQATLRAVGRKGTVSARKLRRAQILLLADEGRTDDGIAGALQVGRATVERTRKRFVDEGLEAALVERPRPGGRPKLDATQQATVVALACTTPPEGRLRWTLKLLTERVVALETFPDVSDDTIRRLLKKTSSSRG